MVVRLVSSPQVEVAALNFIIKSIAQLTANVAPVRATSGCGSHGLLPL